MLLSTLTGGSLAVATRRFMPLLVLLMNSWLLQSARAGHLPR